MKNSVEVLLKNKINNSFIKICVNDSSIEETKEFFFGKNGIIYNVFKNMSIKIEKFEKITKFYFFNHDINKTNMNDFVLGKIEIFELRDTKNENEKKISILCTKLFGNKNKFCDYIFKILTCNHDFAKKLN